MEDCVLKWILISVCVLIILTGIYLSFKREIANIIKGKTDLNSGSIEGTTFKFNLAIGILLIIIGIVGSYFSIKDLPNCQEPYTEVQEPVNITDILNDANAAFSKENWGGAKLLYDTLLNIHPNHMEALEKRGFCLYRLNQTSSAISDFTTAISLDTNKYALYFYRGNAYLQVSNYRAALRDFNKLLKKRPNHPGGYNQRGLIYINLGDTTKACNDFQKAERLGNRDAVVNIEQYCN